MAVVKLTASRKAVNFIDDQGNSYITSLLFLNQMLASQDAQNFLLLTRMPDKISLDRFKQSPVYNTSVLGDESKASQDSLSDTTRKERETAKAYVDREVF